jgi:hypothetical protein
MDETRESARVRKMVAGGEGKRLALGADDGRREQAYERSYTTWYTAGRMG